MTRPPPKSDVTNHATLEVAYFARSGVFLRAEFQQPPVSTMPVEHITRRR
jgi:hypothetical protein